MLRKAGFRSAREKPERALAGTFPRPLEGTATEIAIRERASSTSATSSPSRTRRRRWCASPGGRQLLDRLRADVWEGRGVGAIQVSRDPPRRSATRSWRCSRPSPTRP
jgi:hypothetical protein